jgi:uncharacterized DUF497 family protein
MRCFEFDDNKSLINYDKHGVDFNDAQSLWDDSDVIEVEAMSGDEQRVLVIGAIADKYWSAVVTQRNDNVRIISVGDHGLRR